MVADSISSSSSAFGSESVLAEMDSRSDTGSSQMVPSSAASGVCAGGGSWVWVGRVVGVRRGRGVGVGGEGRGCGGGVWVGRGVWVGKEESVGEGVGGEGSGCGCGGR